MFFPGSRYANMGTYTVTRPDGTQITVVKAPQRLPNPVLGYHPVQRGQRLDLIANWYLSDATTFWRLCDANNAMCPDALAAHAQVGVPSTESS